MYNNIYGLFLVLISASCFGIMGILAKYAYAANISIGTLLFFRFFFATILFWSLIVIKKIPFRLQVKQISILFIMGTGGYAAMALLLFTSFSLLPVSLASTTYYLYPLFVMTLNSVLTKRLFEKSHLIAIIFSLFGIYFVLGTDFTHINIVGLICSLGCAILYSFYIILTEKIQGEINLLISSAFVTSFASISLFIFSMLRQDFTLNFESSGWVPVLGISFFSTFLAILTFAMGIKRIGSSKTALLSIFEPVITVLLSIVLFKESVVLSQKIGIGFILLSALLTNVNWEKRRFTNQHARSFLYGLATRSIRNK